MTRWQLQDAKARFSEVVKKAASEGPQEITVHGEPAAVVLSIEAFKKLTGRDDEPGNMADFFLKSPLKGLELDGAGTARRHATWICPAASVDLLMSYLIDTNVISEMSRLRSSARVVGWLNSVPRKDLFLSVLTLGEIRFGIDRLADAARREALVVWLDRDVRQRFRPSTCCMSPTQIADRWGRLRADVARSTPAIDSLIAATALHHDLRLATRNVKDFARFPGLAIFDPWHN